MNYSVPDNTLVAVLHFTMHTSFMKVEHNNQKMPQANSHLDCRLMFLLQSLVAIYTSKTDQPDRSGVVWQDLENAHSGEG